MTNLPWRIGPRCLRRDSAATCRPGTIRKTPRRPAVAGRSYRLYWQIDFVQQPLLSFCTHTTRWYLLHLATNFGGHRGFRADACAFFLTATKCCSWSAEASAGCFTVGAALSAPEKATAATAAISPIV
jgi:hypothetical protein